jgi:hypothetical protein
MVSRLLSGSLNIVSGKDFFMDCFLKGLIQRQSLLPQQVRICVHPRDCGAIAEIRRSRLFEMARLPARFAERDRHTTQW